MNLVIVTKQFGNYTGATVSTLEILKRISQEFKRVEVFTLKSQKIDIPNVKINIASGYVDLYKKLKKCKDAVGYSDDHLGFLLALAHIKYIHTYHGNWPDAKYIDLSMFLKSFIFIPLYKITVKNAGKVVSVSKYMDKRFVEKNSNRSIVIYNGIKQINSSLKRRKGKSDIPRYLMVGNIDNRKYRKAIQVFNFLNQNGFDKEIDIYGKVINKNLCKRLNEYKFINIKGMVDKINYSNYDALLCTSASENLPVSIVESLISLTPVIAFDVGGIREIVIDGENGFLFNKDDYLKFATTVNNDCVKKIRFSNQKLSKIFDWDYAANNYLNLLKSI